MHRILGPKHRLRFLCEVKVPGYHYIGVGNSTNKKDAEKNAARDFISFLVRNGDMASEPVLANTSSQVPVESRNNRPSKMVQVRPNKSDQPRPQVNVVEMKELEEAESLDMNGQIHGNWTIENASAKLNHFTQTNKLKVEYRYTPVGPDHERYLWVAGLTALLSWVGLTFRGRSYILGS